MKWIAIIVLLLLFVVAMVISDGNVRAAILGLVTAIGMAIMAHHHAAMRDIEARHFPEKRQAYTILFDLIFDLLKAVKTDTSVPDSKLNSKMIEFRKQLLIWGSHNTMEAFMAIEGFEGKSSKEIMLTIEKLLRAIRQDLGHDDSMVPEGRIVSMLLDEDARKVLSNSRERK